MKEKLCPRKTVSIIIFVSLRHSGCILYDKNIIKTEDHIFSQLQLTKQVVNSDFGNPKFIIKIIIFILFTQRNGNIY